MHHATISELKAAALRRHDLLSWLVITERLQRHAQTLRRYSFDRYAIANDLDGAAKMLREVVARVER
jgi:hypothetical protein